MKKTIKVQVNREEARKHLDNSSNGAVLFGIPGVGKTYLVRTPRMISASVIAMEYQANGLEAVKAIINNQMSYNNNTVVIDDLGLEEDVRHFGNGLDPIAYIVQRIYDINQTSANPIKIFFTTNLDKIDLTKKYGIRVIERIWEMCDRVIINDTNLRM